MPPERLAVAYLLGRDISHSLSPALHNAAFGHYGCPVVYRLLDVGPAHAHHAWAMLRAGQCVALNVTMPYKQAAACVADRLSSDVRIAQAANLVYREGADLVAENTDIVAMATLLEQRRKHLIDASALVIGAGGAAAAALVALSRVAVGAVLLAARRIERARDLARRARAHLDLPITPLHLAQLGDAISRADLVVNCTPAGLPAAGVPYRLDGLSRGALFYDFVYTRDGLTPLQLAALEREAEVCDGAAHLLAQAFPTFERISGRPAPRALMSEQLTAELGRPPLTWSRLCLPATQGR